MALIIGGAFLALGLVTSAVAMAKVSAAGVVGQSTWLTNGEVDAITTLAGRVYIGGTFTYVGPFTGPGATLSRSASARVLGSVALQGVVRTVVSDGSGGYFAGGDLYSTDVPGTQLLVVHVSASGLIERRGTLEGEGEVDGLARSGNTLYIGGEFSSLAAQQRNNLAAMNISTGRLTVWNPNVLETATSDEADVDSLILAGQTVYAGGTFSEVAGRDRLDLVAFSARTGRVLAWNPDVGGEVYAMARSGSTIYIGGESFNCGGRFWSGLEALSIKTGRCLTRFNPNPDGEIDALATGHGVVYAGGAFSHIGGKQRQIIASLDPVTGVATGWNPAPKPGGNNGGDVDALVVTQSTVYAGGDFSVMGGRDRDALAAVSARTARATEWSPAADDTVQALAVSESTIYVGGIFDSAGGFARQRLAAFDTGSGAITGWNPGADRAVNALTATGSTIFAGGRFTRIGGRARQHLAALSPSSNSAGPWTANPNAIVRALLISGGELYVGGNFTRVRDSLRDRLAAFDLRTRNLTPWNPAANGDVYTLATSNLSTVFAGGQFTRIDGRTRYFVAALRVTAGAVTPWNAHLGFSPCGGEGLLPCSDDGVFSIAPSDSTVYVGGLESSDSPAAFDATTGDPLAWNAFAGTGGEDIPLALSGSTLYAGGSGDVDGDPPVVALNAATGAQLPWPSSTGSQAWNQDPGDVTALTASSSGVYVGTTGAFVLLPPPATPGSGSGA